MYGGDVLDFVLIGKLSEFFESRWVKVNRMQGSGGDDASSRECKVSVPASALNETVSS